MTLILEVGLELRENKDTLTPERLERLDALGFVWDPHTEQWEEGFSKLQQFKEREGHCRVPQGHKEGDFGSWKLGWNSETNKDKLTPERLERLDALGFVWDHILNNGKKALVSSNSSKSVRGIAGFHIGIQRR